MRSRLLAFLAALALAATASANSLILDATTKSLELETSSTASTDYVVSWADNTSSAFTPGSTAGNITTATTTTITAAPASSTQRQIKFVTLTNKSTTTAQTVTLKLDVSATEYRLRAPVTLAAGEALTIDANGVMQVLTAAGLVKNQDAVSRGYEGREYPYMKPGTAKDAAGYWIAYAKDAGFPGAMSLGTPGVNGTDTDCSVATSGSDPRGAAELGAHVLPDPSTGSLFLTDFSLTSAVSEMFQLVDVLWYNTGLTVTTTTNQAITFGTGPARDLNGSTNGEGLYAALYALTALGNAGVISNTTISYTDSDGNAGNTGTFTAIVGWQAPATPVIGTWIPFQLAAGDRGIRSIEGITLGTTYTSGTMSLIVFRPLASAPVVAANNGSRSAYPAPGVHIWPNSCIWMLSVGSASAGIPHATYTITER